MMTNPDHIAVRKSRWRSSFMHILQLNEQPLRMPLEVQEFIKKQMPINLLMQKYAPPPPALYGLKIVPDEEATFEYLKDSFSEEKAQETGEILHRQQSRNKKPYKMMMCSQVLEIMEAKNTSVMP